MKLRELTQGELLALIRRQVAKGKVQFRLYLNPKTLPPSQLKAYREVAVEDQVAGLKYLIFTKPHVDGGWLLHIKVVETAPFNGIHIPKEVAEKVKKQ